MRINLHIHDESDGQQALHAALDLAEGGHKDADYQFTNGKRVYAYRTKVGVTAREHGA